MAPKRVSTFTPPKSNVDSYGSSKEKTLASIRNKRVGEKKKKKGELGSVDDWLPGGNGAYSTGFKFQLSFDYLKGNVW